MIINIVFSTTRQWNPGDEFIRMGCMNLLQELGVDFNPILFNRHPQIRRNRKVDIVAMLNKLLGGSLLERFADDSVKDRPPMDYADLVIIAGTPEWQGRRMVKLYRSIVEYHLPVLVLGIGTGTKNDLEFSQKHFSADEYEAFKTARVITTRDRNLHENLKPLENYYLPCPALLSSKKEKKINIVKRIGLIYSSSNVIKNNRVSPDTHHYLVNMFRKIKEEFSEEYEIEFIAHYIDELSEFDKEFPDEKLHYTYDAKDYLNIYEQFDLVVGCRIHGLGMSASLGIPGIAFAHDARAETVRGFLADMVKINEPYKNLRDLIIKNIENIESRNEVLVEHKNRTKEKYMHLIDKALSDNKLKL